MFLLETEEVRGLLLARKRFLASEADRITEKYNTLGAGRMRLHVRSLFLHPLVHIEREREFIDTLLDEIERESPSARD